jgi:hypothetical protein
MVSGCAFFGHAESDRVDKHNANANLNFALDIVPSFAVSCPST